MPYVEKHLRPFLDLVVREMERHSIQANGDLNYILYAYCKRNIAPGYGNYKNYCAELRQCATEIERRLLGPYEDLKIKKNGDVE